MKHSAGGRQEDYYFVERVLQAVTSRTWKPSRAATGGLERSTCTAVPGGADPWPDTRLGLGVYRRHRLRLLTLVFVALVGVEATGLGVLSAFFRRGLQRALHGAPTEPLTLL